MENQKIKLKEYEGMKDNAGGIFAGLEVEPKFNELGGNSGVSKKRYVWKYSHNGIMYSGRDSSKVKAIESIKNKFLYA